MRTRNPSIKEMKVLDVRMKTRLEKLERSMQEIEMRMSGFDKMDKLNY